MYTFCLQGLNNSHLFQSSIFYLAPLWKAKISGSFCLGTRMFVYCVSQRSITGRRSGQQRYDGIPSDPTLIWDGSREKKRLWNPFTTLRLQMPPLWDTQVELCDFFFFFFWFFARLLYYESLHSSIFTLLPSGITENIFPSSQGRGLKIF